MEAIKAIMTRRSIRKYKNKKIPQALIRKLIHAGMNAPTAHNHQPCVFITITKNETKYKISRAKSQKSTFISTAPLLIACCYDETKSTTSHNIENTALAAENILITAHASGLGACYIRAFDPKYHDIEKTISKALKLPAHVHAVCLISIGYPDEKPKKKKLKPIKEAWKKETYN